MSHMNMCDVAHLNVAFYIEYLRETLTLQCALCQDFCASANRHIKVIQENHSMIWMLFKNGQYWTEDWRARAKAGRSLHFCYPSWWFICCAMVKKQKKVESCFRVAEVARTAFTEKFGLFCKFQAQKTLLCPDINFCRNLRVLQNFHYVLNVRIKNVPMYLQTRAKTTFFGAGKKQLLSLCHLSCSILP